MTQQNTPRFRNFTRREKTSIRQDVKRFEKIGRDHGCDSFDDYAEYVRERTKRDDEGFLLQKSFELFRGFGAYFGDQLIRATSMTRTACNMTLDGLGSEVFAEMVEHNPGWMVADMRLPQMVVVPYLISEQLFVDDPWPTALDDIFDQIIDWNLGYLDQLEIDSAWVIGVDLEPVRYSAA